MKWSVIMTKQKSIENKRTIIKIQMMKSQTKTLQHQFHYQERIHQYGKPRLRPRRGELVKERDDRKLDILDEDDEAAVIDATVVSSHKLRTYKERSLLAASFVAYHSEDMSTHGTVDWLQSLKQFFINVSFHILVASLILMALF